MEAELPRYFGSTDYWLRRAAGAPVAADSLFDKRRKEIHRFTIADVNGPVTLTLPIVKPHGKPYATWRDIRLSDHGNWWHIHLTALESAYGRTPFFEFYIDRFLPFLSRDAVDRFPSVIDFNEALDALIAPILLLPSSPCGQLPSSAASAASASSRPVSQRGISLSQRCLSCGSPIGEPAVSTPAVPAPASTIPSTAACEGADFSSLPYWQPRLNRFGFLAGLSVLDLIFCLGPEAPLWIRRSLTPEPRPCYPLK